MDHYIELFCTRNNISLEELRGKSRKKRIVQLRHLLCYNLRMTGNKLIYIGALLNRDYTTVIFGYNKIKDQKDHYEDIKALCELNPIEEFEQAEKDNQIKLVDGEYEFEGMEVQI